MDLNDFALKCIDDIKSPEINAEITRKTGTNNVFPKSQSNKTGRVISKMSIQPKYTKNNSIDHIETKSPNDIPTRKMNAQKEEKINTQKEVKDNSILDI
eukprot:CAMPEP_0116899404 /NCGR_PEP_ID=MMETSP0467-20121206/7983_1 /TAXON_ID=283647 /ORGANISM="Mesodinium pulex, Strain SPMC105" /LENGTH=98 /DNA_ID=CAMNT_0004572211 /DNA_START=727 /DNA_END=1023 /DNA_ORIENTATION=+